jgi:hypothetical protein
VGQLTTEDVMLAGGSNAIDHGLVMPNVNDGFTGAHHRLRTVRATSDACSVAVIAGRGRW